MNKNNAVIIEKVGNGYVVKPYCDQSDYFSISEINVFQDKGFVSSSQDYQDVKSTLFGFLDFHFSTGG